MKLTGYIDPGSGSFLLQMVLATVVGIAAYFRRALLGLFRRGNRPDPAPGVSVPSASKSRSEETGAQPSTGNRAVGPASDEPPAQ